jgi:tetratricopeptide (TPR) repeat protein
MNSQSMSIVFGPLLAVTISVTGCDVGKTKTVCSERLRHIEEMEGQLFEATEIVDASLRSALMTAYADFSNHCHASEQTPEFLFRRADLLRSAGQYQEAMTQLRDIHDHYKDFDKRPVCAFLVGFIAEVELNDREQARKTYEQVIELHPDSRAAIWSQQSIDNLNVLP